MKTLIIWNGIASEQISGGDNYTLNLINLSSMKKDIIVAKNAENLIKRNKKAVTIPTAINKSQNLFSMLFNYMKRTFQSISIIKKLNNQGKDYDFAISSTPFFYDVFPLTFSKARNKAAIIFHIIPKRKAPNFATAIRFAIANLEKKISYSLIRKYFNTIIAGNEEVKKELGKIFPNKNIITTNASINTKFIDKIKGEFKDKNLALFAGRLVSQKGIFDLVDIMKILNEKYPNLKLVMIGDGPEKQALIQKIKENNVKSIILKGFVSEEEKIRLLKKARFFFFPSYEEGWGIALAEALYCNCLSLCYELPHYKSIFSNYPLYTKLGDKEDFINKFLSIYNSKPNPNQKSFIKRYDDKAVIDDIVNKLDS